jgi:phosphoserine phosphatase RsbU/P
LVRIIDRGSGSAPAEMLRSLLADVDLFVGNAPQHDDITCLLLKRN